MSDQMFGCLWSMIVSGELAPGILFPSRGSRAGAQSVIKGFLGLSNHLNTDKAS